MVKTVRILLLYKPIYLQINYCAMFLSPLGITYPVISSVSFLTAYGTTNHILETMLSSSLCF